MSDAKDLEKSGQYRQMMELWAWKDFQKFMDDLKQSSLNSAIICDDIKDVQLYRGYVKCLDSISSHLSYTLEVPK